MSERWRALAPLRVPAARPKVRARFRTSLPPWGRCPVVLGSFIACALRIIGSQREKGAEEHWTVSHHLPRHAVPSCALASAHPECPNAELVSRVGGSWKYWLFSQRSTTLRVLRRVPPVTLLFLPFRAARQLCRVIARGQPLAGKLYALPLAFGRYEMNACFR